MHAVHARLGDTQPHRDVKSRSDDAHIRQELFSSESVSTSCRGVGLVALEDGHG